MKNILLLIYIINTLPIHAHKINWDNVGPFPIEEKGGTIFYNIDGKKCSNILYDRNQDYRYIQDDGYNIFPVKENGLWGWINHEGKQIVPCKYNHQLWPVIIENETFVPVIDRNTGLYGVLNAYGRTIVPFEYTMMKATSQKYNLQIMTVNHFMIIAQIRSVSLWKTSNT